ncbi:MAG TPA: ABC-2 family transporter protein [Anaerolineae bacterium]|nr:ABC-2 family transporter protein [Anaerolineae bacterium]
MPSVLRTYRALVRTAWATVLEYRAQAVLWIVSWLFPLIMMAVWLAVVDEAGPAAGWDKTDFASYYVAAALVMHLTSAWIVYDWDEDIRTGNLSVKLLKPLAPFHHYLASELGWKLFALVLLVPLITLATVLLPVLHYPITPVRLLAAIASIALGFALNFAMGSVFGILAFWTTQAHNLFGIWAGGGQFFSGWIAPLALFPAGFRQLADLLPFYATLGLPIEILMGRVTWAEAGFSMGVGVAWTVFFVVLYRVLWRAGLRRYEAVGA